MSCSSYPPAGTSTGPAQPGQTALVMGCGDVGSAVGHRLFLLGLRVLLNDLPRPVHARRGMAYTDALFDGVAELDGVSARRIASAAELAACWDAGDAIPVAARPDEELIEQMRFDIVIDATLRRNRRPGDLRSFAAVTIGVGPGFAPGLNCHLAIETQWGERMGRVLRDEPTAPLGGGPQPLQGAGRERFVAAPVDGLWRSTAAIGVPVTAGEVVGHLDDVAVRAPIAGTLRGVTHDAVLVRAGQKLVEVDPRQPPQVFGLGERPRAIAMGVSLALGLVAAAP